MREKTVADLSPQEKQLLQEAEAYLRDKLRNSFEKVLVNCEKLDTQNTGTLDKDAFRTALSRSFACRLTDAEFAVFHLKQVSCAAQPCMHRLLIQCRFRSTPSRHPLRPRSTFLSCRRSS